MHKFLELRDRLRELSDSDSVLVYYCCGWWGAQKQSIPIYLNEWHGLDRAWKGRVLSIELKDVPHALQKYGRLLVVLDETRRSPYPPLQEFSSYVKAKGEEVFRASDGLVGIYLLSRRGAAVAPQPGSAS
jgi:hypothetical protein